jgi:hypothetical protein
MGVKTEVGKMVADPVKCSVGGSELLGKHSALLSRGKW